MDTSNNFTNNHVFKDIYSRNKTASYTISSNFQPPQSAKPKEKAKTSLNLPVIASIIVGTLIPLLIIRKYQGKAIPLNSLKDLEILSKVKTVLKSFNIKYGLKEMLFISFGSILGGLSGGIIFNKEGSHKDIVKESVFQLANVAVPTTIVAGLLTLISKSKKYNGIIPKILSIIVGIVAGMPIAAVISNKLNNTFVDKENPDKRKLQMKDCFVHADDVIGALVLARVPIAGRIQADKALPALYGLSGYEAGTKK
jgi:hypothetical protein